LKRVDRMTSRLFYAIHCVLISYTANFLSYSLNNLQAFQAAVPRFRTSLTQAKPIPSQIANRINHQRPNSTLLKQDNARKVNSIALGCLMRVGLGVWRVMLTGLG
jgi:hypothetical protein